MFSRSWPPDQIWNPTTSCSCSAEDAGYSASPVPYGTLQLPAGDLFPSALTAHMVQEVPAATPVTFTSIEVPQLTCRQETVAATPVTGLDAETTSAAEVIGAGL